MPKDGHTWRQAQGVNLTAGFKAIRIGKVEWSEADVLLV